MSWRPKWQNFRRRDWEPIRDAWLANTPTFPAVGAHPDPGLEQLVPLLGIDIPENHDRYLDVPGLRTMVLWEAVFLFHKCAHTNLAAQRLGQQGMHSWCLFNAYHSAYLGAKGIMALLGVALPNLKGRQVAIDLYPEPSGKKGARVLGSRQFEDFLIVRLKPLEQRYLWEAFQRVIRMSDAGCWDIRLREELLDLSYEAITPPRNHFLYQAHFWPLNDLILDTAHGDLIALFGTELDIDHRGFLLRLSFSVYRLFEQLMNDLAEHSSVIKEQVDGSRFLSDREIPELGCYRNFLSQLKANRIAGSDRDA
jgi:hypothetical protein